MKKFALITGGSQGLGRAIAEELAQRGVHLILVALDTPELYETADFLRHTYSVQVETFATDLTQDYSPRDVFEFVEKNDFVVQYLINNAGVGYTGKFDALSEDFINTIIKLNVLALTKLTHLFIPILKNTQPAYILNISSMAGLYTMPFKTAYSASKQYVYAFSRALREELRGSGVGVTVLCPGGILTNPKVLADTQKIGKAAQILSAHPDFVAREAVNAMLAGKTTHIPKLTVRLYAMLRHLIPYRMQLKIIAKALRKKYLEEKW
ncbi:MAG: SDR family oxidoreductase [Raineya sp.]